jgi:predicted DNA-binding transcriptional regulator AlpA
VPTLHPVEPIGTREIAERLGVTRKAVDAWRMPNHAFPEPRWTVGGRPAWDWDEVEDWARRTGRLSDPGVG